MNMRRILILILMLAPLVANAQKPAKLKRKYFGKYKGTVPAYEMNTGRDLIQVSETPIMLLLSKGQVSMTVGSRNRIGTYEVMFKTSNYYLLDVTMDGDVVSERLLVYVRGKRISRDGMYPQPVAELKKFK